MNGSIVGTLSEERIREVCKKNLLNSDSENVVVEIVNNWDKEVNDEEDDRRFAMQKIQCASEPDLICQAIIEIAEEFFYKKRSLAATAKS